MFTDDLVRINENVISTNVQKFQYLLNYKLTCINEKISKMLRKEGKGDHRNELCFETS